MYNVTVRRASLVVCFYMGACGGGDGINIDAALGDAPPSARCDPTAAFGAAKSLATLNGPTEDLGGRLSADQLAILFSRTNSDMTWDIYGATRSATSDAFGTPQVVGPLNTIYSELWPALTPDGLTVYFMSDRITPGSYGLWVANRASTTASWGPPMAVADLKTGDATPFVANPTAFYFASGARMGAGMADIYRATLDATGAMTMIGAVIGGVDTPASEDIPILTADELHIVFARSNGTDYDVYEASRSATSDGFGAATAVPGLATAGFDELPSWISGDGCDLYYSSAAGVTGSDLFVVSRP
jgi:Tol biopolymer transport system component